MRRFVVPLGSLLAGVLVYSMTTPGFAQSLNVSGDARIDGDIDAVNHTVINLAEPVDAGDAATKGYVDDQAGVIRSAQLNRVALLRWYDVVATANRAAVGDAPGAIAFDGEHIWVANAGDNTLTVLRPSDASEVATYPIPAAAIGGAVCAPRGLAYDGFYMWVTCWNQHVVRLVRASTGTFDFEVPVGQGPWGIAFDGKRMWVANRMDGTVSYVDAGALTINTLGTPGTSGVEPAELAFDGSRMWLTNLLQNNVTVIPVDNPASTSFFNMSSPPEDVAFDGTNMWITNPKVNKVTVAGPNLANLGELSVGAKPTGLVFDGINMWVINEDDDDVDVFRASDRSFATSANTGDRPIAGAFDGANVWITNNLDDNVFKL